MFCDDVNGIAIHVGHMKSYIGFIGDETPLYQTDSFIRTEGLGRDIFGFEGLLNKVGSESHVKPLLTDQKVNDNELYCDFLNGFARKINTDLNEVGIVLSMHDHCNTGIERKQLSSILFEKFSSPALFFSNKNVNTLFSSGKISGTVVDFGAYNTEVSPISEGYVIKRGFVISWNGDWIRRREFH